MIEEILLKKVFSIKQKQAAIFKNGSLFIDLEYYY